MLVCAHSSYNSFPNSLLYRIIDDTRNKFVALKLKSITICFLTLALCATATGQRIVVDTASTNKYIIKERTVEREDAQKEVKEEDLSFSDRALSIGSGILNRLKARLNLEEASESLKAKKEKLLGKKEEEDSRKDQKENEEDS